MQQAEKERMRQLYEQEAPIYDSAMRVAERLLLGRAREWVGRRAYGDVLEIAVGTGRNLPYYAADIRLTGIDLSPAMLDIAKHQAASLGLPADLRLGDAEQLEFGDETFDSVVCTYSLCTIPEDAQAVSEMRRVLKPGGTLLLTVHVRSPVRIIHAAQRALEALAVRHAADHSFANHSSWCAPRACWSRSSNGTSWASSNSLPRASRPIAANDWEVGHGDIL